MKKICLLMPSNMISGGVKVMVRLASHLADRYDVTLMYPLAPYYLLNNVLKRRMPLRKIGSLLRGVIHIGKRFAFRAELDGRVKLRKYLALLKEKHLKGFDVIIYPSVWQYHELRRLSLPNVKCIHWSLADYLFCDGLNNSLDHIISAYRSKDVLVAPSQAVKLLLESYGMKVAAVIPVGVDLFFQAPRRDFSDDAPKILGYFQPAWWVKGGATLLTVLMMIRRKYPHLPITLFGHQKSSIGQTGSAVCDRFLTGISSHQVAELYREHDIFLYPSYSDGFQSPPLEAMAGGCAVVMTKVGAATEYAVHDHNALLVSPMDTVEMFLQTERLILDKNLRKRLSEQARLIAPNWTWGKCAEQFDQLISRLISLHE